MRQDIFNEIEAERHAQDQKWGGPDHDDRHGSYDWVAFVARDLGLAVTRPWDAGEFRRRMLRVASLAVAAIEWADRAEARGTGDTVDPSSGEGGARRG
jgi:hypothetical protein